MSYVSDSRSMPVRAHGVSVPDQMAPVLRFVEAVLAGIRLAAEAIAVAGRHRRALIRERSAIAVLSGLSDHALRDIGIHRSEIRYIARNLALDPGADPRSRC